MTYRRKLGVLAGAMVLTVTSLAVPAAATPSTGAVLAEVYGAAATAAPR